jgi:phospholipase C
MGYHTGATPSDQLYSYWYLASHYVLEDHLFEAVPSWSNPSHNYIVSGWSASYAPGVQAKTCSTSSTTPVCQTNLDDPLDQIKANHTQYGWNSLAAKVTKRLGPNSWASFGDNTPEIWNPLHHFADINNNPAASRTHADLANDLSACNSQFAPTQDCTTFPNVSWVLPSLANSEHPPNSIYLGESYVTNLINAIGNTPSLWNHVAIFLSWDDWGGFYDHVVPPAAPPRGAFGPGDIGYGLRVPGMVIGPYACPGLIDSQNTDHDSYLRFIEDDLLSSGRIGTGDGRPDQRDQMAGDLTSDFCSAAQPFTNIPLPPAPTPLNSVTATEEATMLANLHD